MITYTKQEKNQKKPKAVLEAYPQLQQGINLLKTPEQEVVQALIAAEINKTGGKALWIDSKNTASTYTLNKYGNPQILNKVKITRVFTPFQHFNAFQNLEKHVSKEISLVCITGATTLYRKETGGLNTEEAEELFKEAWNRLNKLKKKYSFKILVTLPRPVTVLGYPVIADTDKEIKVEETSQGLKFKSKGYEQLAYSQKSSLQTTWNYWEDRQTSKEEFQHVEKVTK